ncbi:unnamed protein product [Ambrosiozyma monospora]|uniref:Unnamed protein product n=1 Tax=Ambrosiozyma monospora TaxID=43982 RepID=A0A9W6SYD8_AMBMO|nr:unnamed protein product [Ambrosiozyma monospora]
MTTTTSTTATLNLKNKPTKLEVSNDTSLDKRIEQLIRHTGTLKVGQGDKEAVKPGPDPEGLEILPESSKKRMIDAGIDISKEMKTILILKEVSMLILKRKLYLVLLKK